MSRSRILSQELLKLIACSCMLVDHIGSIFLPETLWPRAIGRLAFPIFCFLLVEGIAHTRNPKKYLLRMALCFFLSELPYDYALCGSFTWEHQNVMLTLALGGSMLLAFRQLGKWWQRLVLLAAIAYLAELSRCDYGAYGILLIGLFALVKNRWALLGSVLLLNLAEDLKFLYQSVEIWMAAGWHWKPALLRILQIWPPIQTLSMAALVPIGLYSGKKLTRSRVVQWGFYLFYPVHLAVLWVFAKFLL